MDLNPPADVRSSDVDPPSQPTVIEDDAISDILDIELAMLDTTIEDDSPSTMQNEYVNAESGNDSYLDLPQFRTNPSTTSSRLPVDHVVVVDVPANRRGFISSLNERPVSIDPHELCGDLAEHLAIRHWQVALAHHSLTQLNDPCTRHYLSVNICLMALDDQRVRDQYVALWNRGKRAQTFEFGLRLRLRRQLKDKIISHSLIEKNEDESIWWDLPPMISAWDQFVCIYRRKLEILSKQWAEDKGQQFDEATLTEYTRRQWEIFQQQTFPS